MISVFIPHWFTRFDIMIELFSFLVLLTFFIMSIRNYKLTENKKLFYLGLGFLFIALAEIATILTKFVIYYKTTLFQVVGGVVLKYDILKASDISYDLGFFLYKFLTLAGLYVIYRLPLNDSKYWKNGKKRLFDFFF